MLSADGAISSHLMTELVIPPHRITVTITIMDVVVRMRRRACEDVLRMARAKAMAPRRPENTIRFCIRESILLLADRDKLIRNANGYMLTARAITIATTENTMNAISHL